MRHNGVMGIVAIASCAAVITSTMVGPIARVRHHADKIFSSHNKRITQGVAAGYIGGEAQSVESFAVLGSAQAQLLLADMVEKADGSSDKADEGFAPPRGELGLHFAPFSGAPSGGPTGAGGGAAAPSPPGASPSPPPPAPEPPASQPFSPRTQVAALALGAPPLTAPPPPPTNNPPTNNPPPDTPPTNNPAPDNPPPPVSPSPPVVIPVTDPQPPSAQPPSTPAPSAPAPLQRAAEVPSPPAAVVPEPATWATMILGLAGVAAALRRRRRFGG